MKIRLLITLSIILWLSAVTHGQDASDVTTLNYSYVVSANGVVNEDDILWCPDESCFAVNSRHLENTLLIFDTQTGELLQTFALEEDFGFADTLEFNENASLLLGTLYSTNTVKLWKVASGDSIFEFNPGDTQITYSYFNPFDAQVVILFGNPETRQVTTILQNIETGETVLAFDGSAIPVNPTEWLITDDEHFRIQNENYDVVAEQLFPSNEFYLLNEQTQHVLVLIPNDNSQNSTLNVWDTTNRVMTEINVPYAAETIFEAGWLSSTNVYLNRRSNITVWNTTTGELIAELNLEEGEEFNNYWQWNEFNNSIAFETFTSDETITFSVWDIDEGTVIDLYSYKFDELFEELEIAWRPQTSHLAISFSDRVEIYDTDTGKLAYLLALSDASSTGEECCTFEIDGMLWNKTGNLLLAWWGQGLIYVWNIPQN
jgi:WD40 repeat protein